MSTARRQVFLSVGQRVTASQKAFIDGVVDVLTQRGIDPVTVGADGVPVDEPLRAIRNTVRRTRGTLVIAFERLRITAGTEYPDTLHGRMIAARRQTSIWNHIEAAMTIQAAHPLLVLCQEDLAREGMLDPSIYPVTRFPAHLTADQLYGPVRDAVSQWADAL